MKDLTPDKAGRLAIDSMIANLKQCVEIEQAAHADFTRYMNDSLRSTSNAMSGYLEQIAALEAFRDAQWPEKE